MFDERGVDVAILHPMTRGIMPDRHLGTAIAAAHNELMVSRWLEDNTYADRFRGTIRVNPDDITGALREIAKYADHPRVVQIGVPLQSRELYGKPQYWPLWEAAAAANLPVAVHIEVGAGVSFAPTPNGVPRTYEHYVSFMALNFLYHLMNLIVEGVFEKMPTLKFVWADGAADMLTPFMWRMDCFGRPHLEQTPWAPKMPSDYLPGHTFFIQGAMDGPGDIEFAGEWLGFTGKEDMVMYGSSYPHWQLNELKVPASYSRRTARQALLAKRRGAVRHRRRGRRQRTVSSRDLAIRGGHDDGHNDRAQARRGAHRRPLRRLRCASGTQERGAGAVHPGAVAQQVLPARAGSATRSTTTRRTTRTPTRCGWTRSRPTANSRAATPTWPSSS